MTEQPSRGKKEKHPRVRHPNPKQGLDHVPRTILKRMIAAAEKSGDANVKATAVEAQRILDARRATSPKSKKPRNP